MANYHRNDNTKKKEPPARLALFSSRRTLFSLREYPLPDVYPLLLPMRQRLLRVAGYVGEDVAQPVAEIFQAKHGFPVFDGELDSVIVD